MSHVVLPRALAAGVAAGVAAGALYATGRLFRRQVTVAVSHIADAAADAESSDVCAICLEQPVFPSETQCGHRFCTACFVSWWERARTDGSPRHVKCPMCTAPVRRLAARFAPIGDGALHARSVFAYNWTSAVTEVARRVARALLRARSICCNACLGTYAVGGICWAMAAEAAAESCLGSYAPLPPPADARQRRRLRQHAQYHE